jgi:hypothetical protein
MSLRLALFIRSSIFWDLYFFIRFKFLALHTNQLWVIFHELLFKTLISVELFASINQKEILAVSPINLGQILVYKFFDELAGIDLEIHLDWVLFQSFDVNVKFLPLNVSQVYSMDDGVLSQRYLRVQFLAPVEEAQ